MLKQLEKCEGVCVKAVQVHTFSCTRDHQGRELHAHNYNYMVSSELSTFCLNYALFTSTCLLVQQLVAGWALALKPDRSVHADMGAAAVIDHTFI